jgi:hypothetical protein
MGAALSGSTGRTVLESEVLTIGSSPDNQLVLEDDKVSAHHAEIRKEGEGYTITDLGSTHGVYVNEQRLDWNTPHQLTPGSSITIGDTTFTFEENGALPVIATPNLTSDDASKDSAALPTLADTPASHSAYGVGVSPPPFSPVPPGFEPPQGTNPAYASPQGYLPPPPFQQQGYLPPYAQQPYLPPGYPGIYPGYPGPIPGQVYAPPAPPAQRVSRRTLWIIVSVLLILGVVGGGVAAYVFFIRSTPEKTADTYCNALQGQDYHSAYSQLSSSLQRTESESDFTGAQRAVGSVTTCTHSSANVTGNEATMNLTQISSGQTYTGIVSLIQENNNWKISVLLSSPQLTLTIFCNSLRVGNFLTAYYEFSSDLKRAITEALFEQKYQGVACTFGSINTAGNVVTASIVFIGAAGQSPPLLAALIQDPASNGDWKIAAIQ